MLMFAVACGDGGAGDDDDDVTVQADAGPAPTGRYFPMEIGASWTYDVEQAGSIAGTKTQTVVALEDVGGAKAGVTAFRLRSDKPSGKYTLSWQEDAGETIIRHREQTFAADGTQETEEIYAPGKLRLDEADAHVTMGAMFTEIYAENITDFTMGGATTSVNKTEQWKVVDVDVSVTVPAGTFDCVRIQRTNAVMGTDKTYWFARGVGKVRETGAGQTEELTAYSMP